MKSRRLAAAMRAGHRRASGRSRQSGAVPDVDPAKIACCRAVVCPIYEPGLEETTAATPPPAGSASPLTWPPPPVGEIQFIAAGTPPDEDGSADLQYALAAARGIARHIERPTVVVDKSTVPVGTADRLRRPATAATLAERGAASPSARCPTRSFSKKARRLTTLCARTASWWGWTTPRRPN